MLTTKQKLVLDVQKYIGIKAPQKTIKSEWRGRKEYKIHKTTGKQQNTNGESLLTNNCFECEWTKFSNQDTEWLNGLKKMTQPYAS
jgi:hypothetical protein